MPARDIFRERENGFNGRVGRRGRMGIKDEDRRGILGKLGLPKLKASADCSGLKGSH